MNIAINIIILIYLTFCAFTNPNRFVIVYILFHTSFLGFIPNDIILFNIELSTFLSNIIALTASIKYWKRIEDKTSRYIIYILLLFFIYGILKPIYDGNQNFMLSLIGSKAYTFYFFVIYMITFKKSIIYNKIFNTVLFIGISFSVLYIINSIGIKLVPIAYIKESTIQCHYDSFMPFALLYINSPISNIKKHKFIYTILLLLGTYLGGFFSLFATSILLLPLQHIIIKNRKNKSTIALLIFIGLIITSLSYTFLNKEINSSETFTFQKNAYEARRAVNEFRWELIDKKYELGYGFIHNSSYFLSFYINEDTPYMRTFTFIDSGYTDMMGKFGLIGTILFLLIPISIFIKGFNNKKNINCVLFILQLLAVNATWSVFTYQMGIILLAIAYSFIFSNIRQQQYENS